MSTFRFYRQRWNAHKCKARSTQRSLNEKYHLLAAVAILAAACGTTQGDRAASGGLIGAGAGAAIGSLSGNAGAGAVIGGLGGAVVGAATDPCTVRLGDPVWADKHASREDYYHRCGHYPR